MLLQQTTIVFAALIGTALSALRMHEEIVIRAVDGLYPGDSVTYKSIGDLLRIPGGEGHPVCKIEVREGGSGTHNISISSSHYLTFTAGSIGQIESESIEYFIQCNNTKGYFSGRGLLSVNSISPQQRFSGVSRIETDVNGKSGVSASSVRQVDGRIISASSELTAGLPIKGQLNLRNKKGSSEPQVYPMNTEVKNVFSTLKIFPSGHRFNESSSLHVQLADGSKILAFSPSDSSEPLDTALYLNENIAFDLPTEGDYTLYNVFSINSQNLIAALWSSSEKKGKLIRRNNETQLTTTDVDYKILDILQVTANHSVALTSQVSPNGTISKRAQVFQHNVSLDQLFTPEFYANSNETIGIQSENNTNQSCISNMTEGPDNFELGRLFVCPGGKKFYGQIDFPNLYRKLNGSALNISRLITYRRINIQKSPRIPDDASFLAMNDEVGLFASKDYKNFWLINDTYIFPSTFKIPSPVTGITAVERVHNHQGWFTLIVKSSAGKHIVRIVKTTNDLPRGPRVLSAELIPDSNKRIDFDLIGNSVFFIPTTAKFLLKDVGFYLTQGDLIRIPPKTSQNNYTATLSNFDGNSLTSSITYLMYDTSTPGIVPIAVPEITKNKPMPLSKYYHLYNTFTGLKLECPDSKTELKFDPIKIKEVYKGSGKIPSAVVGEWVIDLAAKKGFKLTDTKSTIDLPGLMSAYDYVTSASTTEKNTHCALLVNSTVRSQAQVVCSIENSSPKVLRINTTFGVYKYPSQFTVTWRDSTIVFAIAALYPGYNVAPYSIIELLSVRYTDGNFVGDTTLRIAPYNDKRFEFARLSNPYMVNDSIILIHASESGPVVVVWENATVEPLYYPLFGFDNVETARSWYIESASWINSTGIKLVIYNGNDDIDRGQNITRYAIVGNIKSAQGRMIAPFAAKWRAEEVTFIQTGFGGSLAGIVTSNQFKLVWFRVANRTGFAVFSRKYWQPLYQQIFEKDWTEEKRSFHLSGDSIVMSTITDSGITISAIEFEEPTLKITSKEDAEKCTFKFLAGSKSVDESLLKYPLVLKSQVTDKDIDDNDDLKPIPKPPKKGSSILKTIFMTLGILILLVAVTIGGIMVWRSKSGRSLGRDDNQDGDNLYKTFGASEDATVVDTKL